MSPLWISAFLDSTPEHYATTVEFWSRATGYPLSPPRGDDKEFATLEPPDGDGFVKVQRLRAGDDRVHLDLHVPDPRAAADRAIELGADELTFVGVGYVVLTSPGGQPFCFVSQLADRKPRPTQHAGGHASRVDQVAIDVPVTQYDRELAFWEQVTGWPARRSAHHDEFRFLGPPEGQPLGILVQRLGADDPGPVRAHLDWGTTDRAAETQRHVGLGATVVAEHEMWTVLTDPTGRRYCLTDADPG
ncbi:VOC family protein [Nocardioides sp. SYSU DS0651]|uniref:VOC family protein n=1 Tax=Nocardioides sp. SYSU DS0651 TaxID=3415955 RepID=UPI003F4BD46E